MKFKEFRLKIKSELKQIAKDIREKKSHRCAKNNGFVKDLWTSQFDFRTKHIAYCLLRGTPYEKIESKHRDPNDYTHKWCKEKADQLVEMYKLTLETQDGKEAVRTSA